uniref:NADH:ubiquinone oxidoreductase subunit V3 n=1 Tax=Cyprinus carpio TaxID=7962 RepID=A0A8C2B4K5_CYPCA
MATSLLRLGRLGSVKRLLRGGWSTPRTPLVAALCTEGDVPPKTAKASVKTIEADERASLLAYKPAVTFPSKLSATGFLPKDIALGESETIEAVSTAAANETTAGSLDADAAAAEEITEVPPTNEVTTGSEASKASDVEAEGQKDEDDSSSSSSSSSDSDSDSDSDDEKPETETPVESGEKAAQKKSPGLTIEVDVADEEAKPGSASFGEAQENAETVTEAKPEEVPEPEIKAEDAVKVAAEVVPEVPTEASPEEVVKTAVEASPGVAPEAPGDAAAKPEPKAEAGTPAAPSEELVDPAPVAADAVEARDETSVVETPEGYTTHPYSPEPEPFDDTTYKNLQHHHYNMYTFADVDVALSKYRLPQPSSGRVSPGP